MSDVTHSPEAVEPLSPDEETVIRALSRVIYSLPRAMDADLVRERQLSLIEYLTMVHLSEAPCRRLRMSDLSVACETSLSGMTRIVNRMESQGIVQRAKCEEDGRGWNAVLTDLGLARLREAWPTNLASARRHFLDHLEGLDLKALGAALHRIAT
ncbi:MarR family transcriptional regulator [Streptomyces sp. NPDC005813]|uniref:MarR family winged helix-turn-helix transcriptional regulator n=1 Tax=Streptomyces sp. NPDC005813 TaxID=3155592 RepID=UPI0033C219E8